MTVSEEPDATEVKERAAAEPGDAPAATARAAEEAPPAAAPTEAAPPAAADAEDQRQRIENLTRQLEQAQDRFLRAQAEMDNLRKRTARDIENAHKYALDRFVRDLLPVVDTMELGISASTETVEDIDSLREGMDLTLKKFLGVLEQFGVEIINPAQEKFDPDRHQAVTMQEAQDAESGQVTAVLQKGYQLNGRLVRPAMVVVAK